MFPTMRLLPYKDLDLRRVQPAFDKVRAAIEADDFRTADVKKLHVGPYYRARLGYADRLLLQFARVPTPDGAHETVCLALEVIENHVYERSRFLRGAKVDEAKVDLAVVVEPQAAGAAGASADATPLRCAPASRPHFELLDKPLVFDEAQEAASRHPAPLVIVGSAGSGKTAVTLSRLREATGRVLYVTLSTYLARSAQAQHGAHGYENPAQDAEFLSYREFLETLRMPEGREVAFDDFREWFDRHHAATRVLGDVDARALFEEFRGVLGARPDGPLELAAYLALGPRQSMLPPALREPAHALFARYRQWLQETGRYDVNLVAHAWRPLARPVYDFIAVDEVQDLTAAQLALVLACLRTPGQFLLCGDAHQVVHPNFFSWAAVKSLFWQGLAGGDAQPQPLQVLQANFRNTQAVNEVANALLKLKRARFGAIDRESHFLVQCVSGEPGEVTLVAAGDAALRQLDAATRGSTQHAVIVLRDEDKPAAKARFGTPLVFSVHEAKGLEYAHVVLFDIVSGQRAAYAEVCDGVGADDLREEGFDYGRARDKADRSLERFKFHVNALYVAMTRAIHTLVIVESEVDHPIFGLLGLAPGELRPPVASRAATKDEWAQEARRLEQQGKGEQARAIRETHLTAGQVPWTPWSRELISRIAPKALARGVVSAKLRQPLMEYGLWHGQHRWVQDLSLAGYPPAKPLAPLGCFYMNGNPFLDADRPTLPTTSPKVLASLRNRLLQPWAQPNFKHVLRQCDLFGVDHRTETGATPLMMAARAGNAALIDALLERAADVSMEDEFGHTAWMHAVNRAMEEPAFAGTHLPAVFDRLAPAFIDVGSGTMARVERRQAEYWLLTLMLAGMKTQWSFAVFRHLNYEHYEWGSSAVPLRQVLENLPLHLWSEKRRLPGYLEQVLERSELKSDHPRSRRLWWRYSTGSYVPNPAMLLRSRAGWRATNDALRLDWIERGTGGPWNPEVDEPRGITRYVQMLEPGMREVHEKFEDLVLDYQTRPGGTDAAADAG
jgi:hypothetical protein